DSVPVLAQLNGMLDDILPRFALPTQSGMLTHGTQTRPRRERGAPRELGGHLPVGPQPWVARATALADTADSRILDEPTSAFSNPAGEILF
ncbi:hypothetical protein Q6329_27140, partial [Klebsiella pneumoniae]|nr:hypothetical protein [Klebsiella pneumoniae]